jgi:hypothetical protein
MNKAMIFWKQHPNVATMHVSYYDMLKNPIEKMQQIYAFVDLSFDDETVRSLQAVDQENKQNKYGVHKYALADFNLTNADIETAFETYRTTFNIPYE